MTEFDTQDTAVEEIPAPQPRELAEGQHYFWGNGRRKSAVARVRIRPGSGIYKINGRSVENFFTEAQHRTQCTAPLEVAQLSGQMDVFVNVQGGGITGQAGAVLLGLARAIKEYDPSQDVALRQAGFLTRDAREVERKKYGQRGARRRFQFSKR